jgi:two-component system, NarL family, sensor histidine kinase NreB
MRREKTDVKLKPIQVIALIVIFILGVTGSLLIHNYAQQRENDSLTFKFNTNSKEYVSAIQKEINSNLQVLTSIGALYSVSDTITRADFKDFNSHILEDNNSLQAIEWIPKVPIGLKENYETRARNDGLTNFHIKEKNNGEMIDVVDRPVYYPVYFIEPLEGNEKALGFDLSSDLIRYEALKKSVSTNEPVATEGIDLVQEQKSQKGILIFDPVKKNNRLIGFSLGVYRVGDLISNALSNLDEEMFNISVFDISSETGEQLLAKRSTRDLNSVLEELHLDAVDGLHYKQNVQIADREWTILSIPTKRHLDSIGNSAILFLIIGCIISLGMFYYVYRNFLDLNKRFQNQKILESEVKARTIDLMASNSSLEEAIKKVTDYKIALDASSIVAITDLKGTILYVNDKFVEISKYSKTELIGQNQRIVNSAYHNKEFWDDMWATIGKGQIWSSEIRNKNKEGAYYWVATTIVPLLGVNSKPKQYMSIRTDITKRKTIEQKLVKSILFSQEKDREFFAEDLHEGLAQTLAGLSFQIEAIESKLEGSTDTGLMEQMSLMREHIGESLVNTRKMASALMPRTMMKFGLISSLEHYLDELSGRSNIRIKLTSEIDDSEIDKEIEITVYRSIIGIINQVTIVNFEEIVTIRLELTKSELEVGLNLSDPLNIQDKSFEEFLLKMKNKITVQGGQMIINQQKKGEVDQITIRF